MPTHDEAQRFWRDWDQLTSAEQKRFKAAVQTFVACLRNQPPSFSPGLRVKPVGSKPGVWEMSWAPDGRATFQYGQEVQLGMPHVIWRRIGGHDIFRNP